MKARLLLMLVAGLAIACSDKPAGKPAPAAPKVEAPKTTQTPPAAKSVKLTCTGTCDVTVNVTETVTGSTTTCTVDPPSHDPIEVTMGKQPTLIKWTLTGAQGYKFAQSPGGIVFGEKGSAPPSGVMQNGKGGAAVATVTDNHTSDSTKGSWKYAIYVEKGSTRCKHDPTIDNN